MHISNDTSSRIPALKELLSSVTTEIPVYSTSKHEEKYILLDELSVRVVKHSNRLPREGGSVSLTPGDLQGLAGRGSEQPNLAIGVPVHRGRGGLDVL